MDMGPLGVGVSLWTQKAGGAAATALPALANIVARWSPDDTAKLNGGVAPSDGTAISSFQDSVSGITLTQATGANQPIYKASGKGGKPYLLMAAAKNLAVTTNSTLNTAMSGGDFTVMAFYRNITAAGFNIVCSSGTTPVNFFAGSASYTPASTTTYSAGVSSPAAYIVPYNGSVGSTDLQSVGLTNSYNAGGAIGNFAQVYLNGCSQLAGGGSGGHNGTFALGIASSANSMIGELYDVIIWNKSLSPQEALQVHKWACEKYTQTPPWVTYGKFYVALGSSQAAGTGVASSPAYNNYVTQAVRTVGMPVGTYSICGYSAQGAPTLNGMAQQGLYNMPALTGVPTNLSWLEYYNTRGRPSPSADVLGALTGIKGAGFNKLGLMTLTDDGGGAAFLTTRNTFLTNVIAGYAAAGVNDLMRIDLDGVINVSGVGLRDAGGGTAFAGSTYFAGDLIHQTTLGYTTIASYLSPVLATW